MAKFSRARPLEAAASDAIDPDHSASLVLGQLTGKRGPAPGVREDRRQGNERRGGFWRAFIYGNFRPRRRLSRRQANQHEVWFDWHEPRVLYLGLAVLLLSCTDALFTLNLLTAGASEGNPLMEAMLGRSIDRFLAVKISLTAVAVVILVAAARWKLFGLFRVVRVLEVICVGYMAVIGYELYLFQHVFELEFTRGMLIPWPNPW